MHAEALLRPSTPAPALVLKVSLISPPWTLQPWLTELTQPYSCTREPASIASTQYGFPPMRVFKLCVLPFATSVNLGAVAQSPRPRQPAPFGSHGFGAPLMRVAHSPAALLIGTAAAPTLGRGATHFARLGASVHSTSCPGGAAATTTSAWALAVVSCTASQPAITRVAIRAARSSRSWTPLAALLARALAEPPRLCPGRYSSTAHSACCSIPTAVACINYSVYTVSRYRYLSTACLPWCLSCVRTFVDCSSFTPRAALSLASPGLVDSLPPPLELLELEPRRPGTTARPVVPSPLGCAPRGGGRGRWQRLRAPRPVHRRTVGRAAGRLPGWFRLRR